MTISDILARMNLTESGNGSFVDIAGNQFSLGYIAACAAIGSTPEEMSELAEMRSPNVEMETARAVGDFLGKWLPSEWSRMADFYWANSDAYQRLGRDTYGAVVDRCRSVLPRAIAGVQEWERATGRVWREDVAPAHDDGTYE